MRSLLSRHSLSHQGTAHVARPCPRKVAAEACKLLYVAVAAASLARCGVPQHWLESSTYLVPIGAPHVVVVYAIRCGDFLEEAT